MRNGNIMGKGPGGGKGRLSEGKAIPLSDGRYAVLRN